MNKITPADLSDPQELVARAAALSIELGTVITPGFDALVFKASRGIEDIYDLTYIRKDGSRFPAVVSVTALPDPQDSIIGFLLIGTDNTGPRVAEKGRRASEARYSAPRIWTPRNGDVSSRRSQLSYPRTRAAPRRSSRSCSASSPASGDDPGE